MTTNAVLTWHWNPQYELTLTAGPHGSIIDTGSWFSGGEIANLQAAADAYYRFDRWTGDVASISNPCAHEMVAPAAATACFAEELAAHDVPRWWLASHGLTNADWDTEAMADRDGDSLCAWEEFAGDTDPTNENSVLRITNLQLLPGGAIQVDWSGGVWATQIVECAPCLQATGTCWRPFFTNLPPTTVATGIVDTPPTNSARYYRLRAMRR